MIHLPIRKRRGPNLAESVNGRSAGLTVTDDHLSRISAIAGQPFMRRAGHLFVQLTSASIEKDVALLDDLSAQSNGEVAAERRIPRDNAERSPNKDAHDSHPPRCF